MNLFLRQSLAAVRAGALGLMFYGMARHIPVTVYASGFAAAQTLNSAWAYVSCQPVRTPR